MVRRTSRGRIDRGSHDNIMVRIPDHETSRPVRSARQHRKWSAYSGPARPRVDRSALIEEAEMMSERRAMVTIGCSALAMALAACGGSGGGSGSTGPVVPHSVQGLYVATYHVTYPGVTEMSLPLTDTSGGPSGAWSVPNPAQLAFDANGLLYASSPPATDTSPRQIVIHALPQPGAGATVATLDMPAGMQPVFFALDPAGDLWVADANSTNIYEFTPPFSGAMTPPVAATISGGFTPAEQWARSRSIPRETSTPSTARAGGCLSLLIR